MLSLKKSIKEEKKVKQLLNIWQYLNIQILRFLETKRKIKQRQKKDLLLSGRTKLNKIEKTISKAMSPKKKLKNSCFRTVGEKKNLTRAVANLFFSQFSGDILFSCWFSFAFFVFLFF